ncbi:hypothetical protein G7Z17_g9360 [Cylindrodendrum hubeiense]|uniref:Xylanolytic transcriptional activator regulatory domain-containing protein n=1 Tax=Cylindrodendrum hubeiense TaxID=595255 RepID=A0A9P5H3H9_9HYPO|nr:hypothetical protein G7Z17_g9360 [Cylindrodendrum hubeiense]
MPCLKRGQRCSFVDDGSHHQGPVSPARVSPGASRSFNDAEFSLNDAFVIDPAEGFMALTSEDSGNKDATTGNVYLDNDIRHAGFINPENMDASTVYGGLGNTRIWSDPATEPQHSPPEMAMGIDTMLYDLDGISTAMQSIHRETNGMQDQMTANQAASQNSDPASSTSSPMELADIRYRCSPNVVSTSPIEQLNGPNSIDQRPDFQSTYFGLSSESDPYLLRHYLYNEAEEFPFLRVIYRRAQPEPQDSDDPTQPSSTATRRKTKPHVPIQFLMTSNELGEELKRVGPTAQVADHHSVRSELNRLVNEEHGRRLVLLSYDDVLCVSSIYKKPSSERLWQIVYEGVQSDLHTPRLATISAALLFLNKPRVGVQHVSADTSFTWSFTASIIGLTTSLGLHLDCKSWCIPDWEKRLRRRLWWMAFSEATWRSLLLGRPSVIAKDQWNVSGLTSSDFEVDETILQDNVPGEVQNFLRTMRASVSGWEGYVISQHIATLACIADDIYSALYTIRATQSLADNLDASIRTIRPLREELALWYAKLPMSLKSPRKTGPERAAPIVPSSAACLRFAYLTLEVLLYRALLRPLGGADFGDDMPQVREDAMGTSNTGSRPDDQDFTNMQQLSSDRHEQHASLRDQAEPIISAAEKCAVLVTNFTVELMSWDFAGFWVSYWMANDV